MRGRKGLADIIDKKDFIDMYTSGMSFDEIGEKIGSKGKCVKEYYLENFLGFERFKIKKERIKNLNGVDVD